MSPDEEAWAIELANMSEDDAIAAIMKRDGVSIDTAMDIYSVLVGEGDVIDAPQK